MKFSIKKLVSLVLALVMVLGLMPAMTLPANAAAISGLTDGTIGLSGKKSYWSASGNTISGSITGGWFSSKSDTLTITNNRQANATLLFSFSVSGESGSAKVDGTEYAIGATGSLSKELAPGASVTVSITGKANETASISITGLTLLSATTPTTTFEAPAYGSYTVAYGDTTQTVSAGSASVSVTNASSVNYTLTAVPGSNGKFVGWYNVTTGKYLSLSATYSAQFDLDNTIKAVIVPKTMAVFYVGNTYVAGLAEALDYASANGHKQIALFMSGTVPAGNYTIPAGMTLLMPSDADYTAVGVEPTVTTSYTTPSAYQVLTLADGVTLTVNGTIECEAQLTTMQGAGSARPHGGRPCGAYGAVYMSPDSEIIVNSGASMYAWGYIYGEGTITANSGAKVYESMQVADFPGGSNLSGFVDTNTSDDKDGDGRGNNDYIKSFFVSQYYVQNIEVALKLYAGAPEYMYTSLTVSACGMSTNIAAPE